MSSKFVVTIRIGAEVVEKREVWNTKVRDERMDGWARVMQKRVAAANGC